jgi:hypothetical protein
MSTVRRLYFYGLSLISVVVVVWGAVGLLRTIFHSGLIGGSSLLATGLSLVLVGGPIFYFHWRAVQKDALTDPVERASRVRAVFFYAALAAFLGPIVFALLAVLNRWLVEVFGQLATSAWFGTGQTVLDNLLAILVNLIALVFFWWVLQSDWRANPIDNSLPEVRRLYRYLWMLTGLIILIGGVYNLLRYILYTPGQNALQSVPILAGGITFLLVGAPLWGYHWWVVQDSLSFPAERRSLLRLLVLYIISLAGVIGVLTTLGSVVQSLLRWLFGEQRTIADFIQGNSAEIAATVPLAVMWAYYGRILTREMAALQDQPRRAALRRLYFYILSLLGLSVTFAGLFNLVDFLVQMVFVQGSLVGSFRSMLSGALSALLVGMPLWLITWRSMQAEASRRDDLGDHSRRSVLRKSYLYLVLFILVVGGMTFSGQFLFALLDALLSQQIPADLGQTLTKIILWLLIDVLFLVYHWRCLRSDSQLAQQTLGNLHSAFPTLLILPQADPFADLFLQDLRRLAPRLPVALHAVEQGAPDETMLGAKAILLPIGIALDPPQSLQLWLSEYHGRRLLIPFERESYLLLGQGEKTIQDLAREAARAVRQMAEGEALRTTLSGGPWAVVGYILGGLFALQLVILLFTLMISALFRN